jgi:hypothetical protein
VSDLELGFEIRVFLDTFPVHCLNHTNYSDSDTIPYWWLWMKYIVITTADTQKQLNLSGIQHYVIKFDSDL